MKSLKTISFLLVFLLIIGCQPKDKFDWNAGWSAPKYYGAAPFVEYFYKGKSIAGISANIGADPGWGETSGGYVGGGKFKEVPDSIFVKWVDSPDRYEYEGGIKLPREKMIKLFKEKVFDSVTHEKNDYSLIVTGMAPGGNVTVWMRAGIKNKEIIKFKVKNNGIWQEENKEYQKYIEKRNSSEEFINSDANIFRNIHGIPYKVWEEGEQEYNYDIGFESKKDIAQKLTIAITGLSKDGSYVYGDARSLYDYKENKTYNSKKLPVELIVRWISRDQQQWYEGRIVMPQNLNEIFNKLENKEKLTYLVLKIEDVKASSNYAYGTVFFKNSKNKQKIVKFRLAKLNVTTREFYVSKYSLPKGFVFPKWEGRVPIFLPKNFEYYQEQ